MSFHVEQARATRNGKPKPILDAARATPLWHSPRAGRYRRVSVADVNCTDLAVAPASARPRDALSPAKLGLPAAAALNSKCRTPGGRLIVSRESRTPLPLLTAAGTLPASPLRGKSERSFDLEPHRHDDVAGLRRAGGVDETAAV